MANETNGGTAGPAEVVEVDLSDPAVATRFNYLVNLCGRYLEMFTPAILEKFSLDPNRESFQALILGMLREEMMIDAQIRPLFLAEAAEKNKILILQVQVQGQQPVNFTAKRRVEHCQNAQEIVAQALLVAFTDSPGIRAVLRANGVQYMWLAPKPQGRIILAKG